MEKYIKFDDLLLDLKRDIFYRAKIFIDNMGEFTPFGSELIGTEIRPVVIYDDTEKIIKGQKLIDVLKSNFSKKLLNHTIQASAIAYDVFINSSTTDGEIVKKNALCLAISTDGDNWSEDYYPYVVINNECIWG
jgi:hypothetical protein